MFLNWLSVALAGVGGSDFIGYNDFGLQAACNQARALRNDSRDQMLYLTTGNCQLTVTAGNCRKLESHVCFDEFCCCRTSSKEARRNLSKLESLTDTY